MSTHPVEQALRDWGKEPRLVKAVGTKIEEMRTAVRPSNAVDMSGGPLPPGQRKDMEQFMGTIIWDRVQGSPLQIFIVEHNWADAFLSAGEEVGAYEFRLPYTFCLFEFQISARRLGIVAFQRHESK